MMKNKILLGLGILIFAGASYVAATGAFFSDTETSTGNSFTAGAIDLKVDSTQHYNGHECIVNTTNPVQPEQASYVWGPGENPFPVEGTPCGGTWALKDLSPTLDKFFNFGDIKPGDSGEDTISLHVLNNDAYVCAAVSNLTNDDNGLTGPESKVDTTGGAGQGELGQTMVWKVWNDNGLDENGAQIPGAVAGDNIYQAGEKVLAEGHPANGVLALYDSTTGSPLSASDTAYLGVSWSLPASSGNETQTDSMTGDISFQVEQSRNNANFKCSDSIVPTNTTVVVGNNDLETILANSATSGKWYFYDDSLDVLNNSLGGFVTGPATPPLGTGSAVANPLASASGRTLLTNGGFGGTPLANISAMSYSYYQPSGTWSTNEAPFLRFNVDFASNPAYQGSLVYVPSVNGAVTQGSWQNTGNEAASGALWVYSGAVWPTAPAGPDIGVVGAPAGPIGANARTWSRILADYPGIKMHPLFPQIGMRVGEPGPVGLTANLDKFSITISGNTKTFDFGN